jgi:hypothetical protein
VLLSGCAPQHWTLNTIRVQFRKLSVSQAATWPGSLEPPVELVQEVFDRQVQLVGYRRLALALDGASPRPR